MHMPLSDQLDEKNQIYYSGHNNLFYGDLAGFVHLLNSFWFFFGIP